MATLSVICQFPRLTLPCNCLNPNFSHRPSAFVNVGLTFRRHALIGGFPELRPVSKVQAMDEADWEPEKKEEESETEATEMDEEVSAGREAAEGLGMYAAVNDAEEGPEMPAAERDGEEGIEGLKGVLVDSFYGTDRGMKASSETRAEISEIISQLEAKNPTLAPTEEISLFNGKWILAYTSIAGAFPLLSCCDFPLVKVEEISQTIDTENLTDENSVRIAGPLTSTSISTSAKLEVRSPKRVQMKFMEGVIGTPQLKDSIEMPETMDWSGEKIDLKPIRGLLTFVQDTASSISRTISSQPPFKFSLENTNAESWIITTYLDKDLRISRGDGGCVFVHLKEGSSLLNP